MATARKSRKGEAKRSAARSAKGAKSASARSSGRKAKVSAAVRAPKAARKISARSKARPDGAKRPGGKARAGAKKAIKRAAARPVETKRKTSPPSTRLTATRKTDKETPVRKGKKPDLRPVKKELMQRREELLAKLNRLTATSSDAGEKPVGDRADDASFDLEIDSSYSIAEREAEELRFINVALDKISNGTYGICEECGGQIEAPRLKALPYAVMCLKCKQNEELTRHAPSSEIVYGRLEEE